MKVLILICFVLVSGCVTRVKGKSSLKLTSPAILRVEWDHPYPERVVFDVAHSATLTNWTTLGTTTNLFLNTENMGGAMFFKVGARWRTIP